MKSTAERAFFRAGSRARRIEPGAPAQAVGCRPDARARPTPGVSGRAKKDAAAVSRRRRASRVSSDTTCHARYVRTGSIELRFHPGSRDVPGFFPITAHVLTGSDLVIAPLCGDTARRTIGS